MTQELAYGRSEDGKDYVCALDGVVIPDGATVLGHYDGDTLDGVLVKDGDGNELHQCGKEVTE